MIKTILSLLALSFSVMLYATGANANDMKAGTMSKDLTQSCKSDLQKYCSDVTKGEGREMACLKAHDDKLSDACSKQWQQAKTEWKGKMKAMHAACSGDVQKFCSDASGPMDVKNCLDEHKSDLTTACTDFRSKNKMTG